MGKAADEVSAKQVLGEQKLVTVRDDQISTLKEEASAVKATADAYKVYNQQALYGGRGDMQSHLSDMAKELQYEELLNRQRWLMFTSPQQAYAWRQNEYNQRLLMNRAEWAGYATADQYLAYLQRQTTAYRALNDELLNRTQLYKQNTDAALAYWNAVEQGARRTNTVIAPQAELSGVQAVNAALAGVPGHVTTQVVIDDHLGLAQIAAWKAALSDIPNAQTTVVTTSGNSSPESAPIVETTLGVFNDAAAKQELATWMEELRMIPEHVEVSAIFDDADALAKATAFFAFMREHRNFGATEILNVMTKAGAAGGGGGPPPVAPTPGAPAPEPNPEDLAAITAAVKNLANAWAEDVKWENAYTAALEQKDAAEAASAASSGTLAKAQTSAAAATAAAAFQATADAAALKAQTAAAAAAAAVAAAQGKSATAQASANAMAAAANVAAAKAAVAAAAANAANAAAQNGATVAATKVAAANAANAASQTTLAAATTAAAAATNTAAKANQYAGFILASATVPVIGAAKGWFGLSTQLYLFGGVMPGVLGHIALWHLGLEQIFELLAVLIPAIIAFGAAIAAAVPTVQTLYQAMSALHTVNEAFGKNLYPLTGGLDAMAQATQPYVYVLFGEALTIVTSNTGKFTTLAVQATKVLDLLGARIVAATTGNSQFGALMKNAANDLMGFGTVIGNVFGILGNLLKVMPGYAEVFLNVWVKLTGALEAITASPVVQWLLSLTLAAHGALIYIGLLGTAFAYIVSAGLPLIASGLFKVAQGLAAIGATTASDAMLSFASSASKAAALPWGWISIVIAGMAVLAYEFLKGSSAVNQYAQAVQKAVEAVPVTQLGVTLTQEMTISTQQLAMAQKAMGGSVQNAAAQFGALISKGKDMTQAQGEQANALLKTAEQFGNNQAALATLRGDYANYSVVLKAAKGNTDLINAAGLSSKDIITANSSTLQQYVIEVQAAANAQNALALGTGRTAAALNAQTNDWLTNGLPAMQKVTQAEDLLINTVIGGEQGLVAFEQTIVQMGTDAHVAGVQLGNLHGNSLTLTNDFYNSVVPALQKMVDGLQSANATTGQLTTALATGAGQAVAYAGSNVAARATIVSLINNALGPGTVSLQNLDKWVKANGTSMNGLSAVIDQVTINASQLTGVLQNNLNVMLAQAAANALGGQKALDQFAQGVLNGQSTTQSFINGSGQQVLKMFQQMYQGDLPKAKAAFIDWAKNGLGLSQTAADNLWTDLTTNLTPAMQATQAAAEKAAGALDNNLLKALQTLGYNIPTQALTDFSNAIITSGDSSTRTANARAQLIKDLENAGLSAQAAKGLVQNLQTQIDQLQGKNVPVTVTGSGSGTITFAEQNIKNAQTGFLEFHAAGGQIGGSGGPTQDNQMIMASTGEYVVNAASVNRLQRDYGPGVMRAINSYAQGGSIGTTDLYGIAGAPQWMADQESYAATQAEGSAASAMYTDAKAKFDAYIAALQAALFVPGAGSGLGQGIGAVLAASSGYQAFINVAAALGWGPALLQDWVNVEEREAGFSLTATNPTSGAYGMAQFILGPSEYYTYGGNPNTYAGQAIAMANYIRQRYGTPAGAWAHEQAFNWYAMGGPVGWPIGYAAGGPVSGPNMDPSAVVDAIKGVTASQALREAMLLGSYLSTDFGQNAMAPSYGPFDIYLGKKPSATQIAQAKNAGMASRFALKFYQQAFTRAGGPNAYAKDPFTTALNTAGLAEHGSQFAPGSPAFSISSANDEWSAILGYLGLNSSPFPGGGGGGTSGGGTTTVPNVIGKTVAAADTAIKAAGLVPGAHSTWTGTVNGQTPRGGAKVRKGSVVDLSTTGGPSGGGSSGSGSTGYANIAAMEADWASTVADFKKLQTAKQVTTGTNAVAKADWAAAEAAIAMVSPAEKLIQPIIDKIKGGNTDASAWGTFFSEPGGGILTALLAGNIPDKKFWTSKTTPATTVWSGNAAYDSSWNAANKAWTAFLADTYGGPAPSTSVPSPVAPPPSTTATLVNLSKLAGMGGPAIPVMPVGGGTMGFAHGGQVGLGMLSNMLGHFAAGGPVALATTTSSGSPVTLDKVVGMLSSASSSVPNRTLSEGASATRPALNVETMNINNPVSEPPSQSISRAGNRMAFLAGRGV